MHQCIIIIQNKFNYCVHFLKNFIENIFTYEILNLRKDYSGSCWCQINSESSFYIASHLKMWLNSCQSETHCKIAFYSFFYSHSSFEWNLNEFTVNREQNVICFTDMFPFEATIRGEWGCVKKKKKGKKSNPVLDVTSVADKTNHTLRDYKSSLEADNEKSSVLQKFQQSEVAKLLLRPVLVTIILVFFPQNLRYFHLPQLHIFAFAQITGALLLLFTLYSCVQSLVTVSRTGKVLWLRRVWALLQGVSTHEADNQTQYHCEVFYYIYNERHFNADRIWIYFIYGIVWTAG